MSLCKDCITGEYFLILRAQAQELSNFEPSKGVRHEGSPEGMSSGCRSISGSSGIHGVLSVGKFEDIDGIDCYVATPTAEYPTDKVILFLTDALGIALINNQVSSTLG